MWLEPFLLSEVYFPVVSWLEPHFSCGILPIPPSTPYPFSTIHQQKAATSHAGTARWGEKAWQSIESQPTDSSPTRLVAWGNECSPWRSNLCFFCWGYGATQVTCWPRRSSCYPVPPREDPPHKKKHRVTRKNTVSHGIFTCVILLYYSLYQLLCPVCPSTVCQGSPCFVHSAERT